MVSSSIFSGSIALLLAALLGFLAAWIWRGKRLAFLESQAARLRRDRRALGHRLSQANSRLDSSNFRRGETEQELADLKSALDRLETEHAQLAASYNNLKQGIVGLANDDDDWFEGLDDSGADQTADASSQSAQASDAAREDALRELQEFEAQLTSTSEALVDDLERDLAKPATSIRPEPADADRPGDPAHPESDHAVSADNPGSTGLSAPLGGGSAAAITAADDATAGPSDLHQQLASQQAEIARLREQMAPLLGLPLAVSAREAERDQLAARLQAREQELTGLNAVIERLENSEARLTSELQALQAQATPKNKKRKKKKTRAAADAALSDRSALRSGPDDEPDVGSIGVSWPPNEASAEAPPANVADNAYLNGEPGQENAVAPAGDPVEDQDAQAVPRQYRSVPAEIDNLKEIRGIGPVLERMLNRLGVYQFRQIAAWDEEDIAFFDAQMPDFRGRIRRDDWVEGAARAGARKYNL